MKQAENILNELSEISAVVAVVPRINVFIAPAGYFEGIEAELQARIAADSLYGTENAFTVPSGYFDGLATSILQKIKSAEALSVTSETETISPLIAAIGNRNIFTVPTGFFEQLNIGAAKNTSAKIIQMKPLRSVFKYATAAVITGLLGLSIINITGKNTETESATPLVQTATVIKNADEILRKGTFENELNSISDKDIEQYLTQNGQDVQAALVASSTEEAALPEATDYLIDENTLDNFLNENNLNN